MPDGRRFFHDNWHPGNNGGREGTRGGRLEAGVIGNKSEAITKGFTVSASPCRFFGDFLVGARKLPAGGIPQSQPFLSFAFCWRFSYIDSGSFSATVHGLALEIHKSLSKSTLL